MTAVFDIGKTNKKLFVFDEALRVVYEKTDHLPETVDDDGFPCEDVHALTAWMKDAFNALLQNKDFNIQKLNFSGYGASFVHLNRQGKPATPLYNYLKPFPTTCQEQFQQQYGSAESVAQQTASPTLGHLNSGMQLYWLKYNKPNLFHDIAVSLHLPQYLASVFTGYYFSDITSVGCHTQLWNFERNQYHDWVRAEAIEHLLPPIAPSHTHMATQFNDQTLMCGIGLHDSSAALIPYLKFFAAPFVLLSTGTWSIALNPFNDEPLTAKELKRDCLCYLSYDGKPVKASRLFLGHEHDLLVKQLAEHFHQSENYFSELDFDADAWKSLPAQNDLSLYTSATQAYHAGMRILVQKQVDSLRLVLNPSVHRIFVDGGFSHNKVFMHALAKSYPQLHVFATAVPQASALGAALAIAPELSPALSNHFVLNQY
jgi:L-fuculokinase